MNIAKCVKVAVNMSGLLLLVLLASPLCASATSNSGSGDAGLNLVEEDARRYLQLSNEALFLIRREDLEQDVTGLQFLLTSNTAEPNRKTSVKCIEIIDMTSQGYRVQNGFIVQAAVDLDTTRTWRSAYDCETGRIFHLYGFRDTTEGFNDLVKSLDLHVKTNSDALVLLASFVSLSYLNSPKAVMRDELDLMRAAIDDFRGVRSKKAFEVYWSKCPRGVKSQVGEPVAKAVGKDFEAVFFSYSNKSIHKDSVLCHDNGSLENVISRSLFRW